MQRITKDSNIEEVMAEIGVGPGEKLRESEKRRRNLEKFAQLRSRNPQTTVSLKDTHTAFVEVDEDSEEGEFKDITITSRPFEQHHTNFPEEYHQLCGLTRSGM